MTKKNVLDENEWYQEDEGKSQERQMLYNEGKKEEKVNGKTME